MNEFLGTWVTFAYGVTGGIGKLRRSAAAVVLTLVPVLSVAPAQAESIRLAALGDSLTQGYGLAQGEGLVPQLQAWLVEQGHDVEVLNAGVSGDTTAGGLSRLDWTLADNPDAMMVVLGGNDLLRGIDPANSRANLEDILARLQAERVPALLVGMPAPGNYGPEFQMAFEAMYPELAEEYGAMLYPDLLQPITEKQEAGMRYIDLMQDDHIHPNAEGVALIVEGLGPVVSQFLQSVETGTGS